MRDLHTLNWNDTTGSFAGRRLARTRDVSATFATFAPAHGHREHV